MVGEEFMWIVQHEITSTSGTFGAVVGVPFIDTKQTSQIQQCVATPWSIDGWKPKMGGVGSDDFPFENR